MAQLGKTWINGFVRSAEQTGDFTTNAQGKVIPEYRPTFVTGFTDGQGWALQDTTPDAHGGGGSYLEVDNMRVRGTMSVYELVIQKVRAICGSLGISQACGKVERVDYDAKYYYLTMEGDDTHGYGGFMAGDFVRCQRWTEGGAKGYWVQIKSVSGAVLTIDKGEFNAAIVTQAWPNGATKTLGAAADNVSTSYNTSLTTDGGDTLTTTDDTILLSGDTDESLRNVSGMVAPAAGDELVQYGNSTDTARQSAVYIHADEDGKPAVDILMGIKSKSFKGCLSVRLGAGLPNVNGLPTSSVGLYAKNGHIVAMDDDGNTLYELSPDGSFNLGKGAIQYDPTTGKVALSSNVSLSWGSVGNVTDDDGKTISDRVSNAETAATNAKTAANNAATSAIGAGTAANNAMNSASAAATSASNAEKSAQEASDDASLAEDHAQNAEQSAREAEEAAKTAAKDAAEAAAAAIPKFVTDWNTNATSISGTSIATPQAAIGSKDGEGKFTGIVMGNTDTTGYQFAAYSDNEAKVVLDPKTGTYIVKGTIYADAGNFSNCTIEETCTITKIEATSGTIGGMTITKLGIGSSTSTSSGGGAYLTQNGDFRLFGNQTNIYFRATNNATPCEITEAWSSQPQTTTFSIVNNNATGTTFGDISSYTPWHAHVALHVGGNITFNSPFIELYDDRTYGDYDKRTANTRIVGFGRNVTEVGAGEVVEVKHYHDIIKITGANAILNLLSLKNLTGKEIVVICFGDASFYMKSDYDEESKTTGKANIYKDNNSKLFDDSGKYANRIVQLYCDGSNWYIK